MWLLQLITNVSTVDSHESVAQMASKDKVEIQRLKEKLRIAFAVTDEEGTEARDTNRFDEVQNAVIAELKKLIEADDDFISELRTAFYKSNIELDVRKRGVDKVLKKGLMKYRKGLKNSATRKGNDRKKKKQ